MTLHAGPTSQTFISQRLRLHYLDWGNRGKPPLVLVHGGRDHARSWDWVAEQLHEDYHVVAMDHRGHGDSDWVSDGNYSSNDMVYDLAQLVHQLGVGPVTIVSHRRRQRLAPLCGHLPRHGDQDRRDQGLDRALRQERPDPIRNGSERSRRRIWRTPRNTTASKPHLRG